MGTAAADARGAEARTLFSDLVSIPPRERREFFRQLPARDAQVVMTRARLDVGSTFGLWQDDPVGFAEDVVGATLYSKQIEVMESVEANIRTAVPSTHAGAKTFSAALLAAWWASVWPLGTARVVTTAPRLRQVKNVMWPDIRRVKKAGDLPGEITSTQWKVNDQLVGEGFSAADWDETAVQGIHAHHLLFIVDEAGGIGHALGNSYAAMLSQPHARELLIGNPPTDEEGSFFEAQSEHALVNTVRISAYDTPNLSGEVTGRCLFCPKESPAHRVAIHLTPLTWVAEAIQEFGEDSAFVVARVHAQFPRAIGQKVIPYSWLEAAVEDEREPQGGNWVRLGADPAADGGDEYVIARTVGYTGQIVHRSSGAANADPANIANKLVEHIHDAVELRKQLHDKRPVHVKIDASGLGWAVPSLVRERCEAYIKAGQLVVLGVRAEAEAHNPSRFPNIRSEMWWNTRDLAKPVTNPTNGAVVEPGKLKLIAPPTRLLAQLSAPRYDNDSQGRTVVEPKKKTKKRVGSSPDYADALNLALYEPPGQSPASFERPAGRIPLGRQAARTGGRWFGGRTILTTRK